MADVIISMEEYEEYNEIKELMDDFKRLVNSSECVSNCDGMDCGEYRKSVVLIERDEIEEIFNRYFGLIDIKIVGE